MLKIRDLIGSAGAFAIVCGVTAGSASAQSVDLDFDATTPPTTVNVTGLTDGAVISNSTLNTGAQSGDADGNSINITLDGPVTDGSPLKVKDNSISAAAYGADSDNSIDVDGLGGASANIGNVNDNRAPIDATASTNTIQIDVDGFVAGDAEVIDNSISSDATANYAANSVTGDFSDQESSTTPSATSSLDATASNEVDTATTNYSIGSLQLNNATGVVTSDADSNLIQILSSTSGTDTVAAEVDENSVSALGRGNVAVNQIDGSNGGALNSFGISSGQIQEATVTTSANGNTISFYSAQTNGIAASSITVNTNTISATSIGNQAVNSIRVSQ